LQKGRPLGGLFLYVWRALLFKHNSAEIDAFNSCPLYQRHLKPVFDMKTLKLFFVCLLAFFCLAGAVQAQTPTPKKGWSNKAKGAAVGAGAGAVTGAVLGGGKGAIIGGAAGAVGGGIIGRNRDKKKDPARYEEYRKKK